jgi:RNA polymerase sigma factor (sigma-70 family)
MTDQQIQDFATAICRVQHALRQLSYREREILKLRFGLEYGYTYTLKEVGYIFRVTSERVRGIQNKSLTKLGKALELDPKCDELKRLLTELHKDSK